MTEIISLVFDFMLLFGALIAMDYAKIIGGSIGDKNSRLMTVGFFLLGIAHLSETILLQIFPDANLVRPLEILHRFIVFFAFILLLIGYRRLAKLIGS